MRTFFLAGHILTCITEVRLLGHKSVVITMQTNHASSPSRVALGTGPGVGTWHVQRRCREGEVEDGQGQEDAKGIYSTTAATILISWCSHFMVSRHSHFICVLMSQHCCSVHVLGFSPSPALSPLYIPHYLFHLSAHILCASVHALWSMMQVHTDYHIRNRNISVIT